MLYINESGYALNTIHSTAAAAVLACTTLVLGVTVTVLILLLM